MHTVSTKNVSRTMPFAIVKNIRTLKMNATCATLTWDQVPMSLINGHFRGYKIKSWPKGNGDDERSIIHYFPEILSRQNLATVCHFEPMKEYCAQIFTTNSHFESDPSSTVHIKMPEGPPGPVQGLKVVAYSPTTVFVKWLPPAQIQGKLKVYHIIYTSNITAIRISMILMLSLCKLLAIIDTINEEPSDGRFADNETSASASSGTSELVVYDSAIPSDVTYHVNDALLPEKLYRVSVKAETGGGFGPLQIQMLMLEGLLDYEVATNIGHW
uniref:Fibronectin type-III domain-containing protein n=1 Tax=Romanomermis culicivorax TaxID=13658 RepID=A0A915IGM5_ROMCU